MSSIPIPGRCCCYLNSKCKLILYEPLADYVYVVGACGYIGLVQFGIGASAMGFRNYFKSKEFLEKPAVKQLQEEHKRAFGTSINSQGYPDAGNGRYSQLLEYDQWVQFNNAQRAHNNMIEGSAPVLAALLGTGLYFPITASILGFIYGTGRVFYAAGYTSKVGADGRIIGAITGLLPTFGLYLTAIGLAVSKLVNQLK